MVKSSIILLLIFFISKLDKLNDFCVKSSLFWTILDAWLIMWSIKNTPKFAKIYSNYYQYDHQIIL